MVWDPDTFDFDSCALNGGTVYTICGAPSQGYPVWPESFLELEKAAEKAGYGLRKIGGRGTGLGRVILTARSRKAAEYLREGRRRALEAQLGCSAVEALYLEPYCRSGWVRERARELLDWYRWLRTTDRNTVQALLQQVSSVLQDESRGGWGPRVREAAALMGLEWADETSVPRLTEFIYAVLDLAVDLRVIKP